MITPLENARSQVFNEDLIITLRYPTNRGTATQPLLENLLHRSAGRDRAKKSCLRGFQRLHAGCIYHLVGRGSLPSILTVTDNLTRADAEKQVKGYSGASYKGYTVADGGQAAADKAWEGFVRDNQRASTLLSGQIYEHEKPEATSASA